MAIRLESFLTSKTVEYIKRVNRLDSTMGGGCGAARFISLVG